MTRGDMHIIPFKKEHLLNLDLQRNQPEVAHLMDNPEFGAALELQPLSFTAIEEGKVYACGGLIEEWKGVARAWALLSENMGNKFMPVHRAVKAAIEANQEKYHRIEMSVIADFAQGCRWARLLGFELESKAKKYSPDGKDCFIYARVK